MSPRGVEARGRRPSRAYLCPMACSLCSYVISTLSTVFTEIIIRGNTEGVVIRKSRGSFRARVP